MADSAEAPQAPKPSRNPLRRLYHWVLSWADHRFGAVALFIMAVAESVFFPIPPDVLMIALILARREKAWRYAAICTAGSVIGASLGYVVGVGLWGATRDFWFTYVFSEASFDYVAGRYNEYGAVAVFAAAFSPIPAIMRWIGPKAKPFIEKWFNWIALIFVILLVAGFWLLSVLGKE
jgi:membrane protein YqaA with SNARE-associated domain